MPQPTIAGVSRMRELGVFRDARGNADNALRRWNLIYGFNGAGKTTLSRVLSSIASGVRHPLLPPSGGFSIELVDGTRIDSESLDGNLLTSRLFVFNSDFVEDNLKWKEGTSSPIFYLGRNQATAAGLLARKEEQLSRLAVDYSAAVQRQTVESRALAENKRATARTISAQLNLGRQYEAPDLARDYENPAFQDVSVLSEEEQQQVRTTAVMEQHLPPLDLIALPTFRLGEVLNSVRQVVSTTIGSIVLEDLQHNERMLGWVNVGVQYHTAQSLEACLFCGSELPPERMEALRRTLDGGFDRLVNDIYRVTEEVKEAQRNAIRLAESNPSENDVSPTVRAQYERARIPHKAAFREAERALGVALAVLSQKAERPNRTEGLDQLKNHLSAVEWDNVAAERIRALNEVVFQHNAAHANFEAIREQARNRLKGHFIAAERRGYRAQVDRTAAADEQVDALTTSRTAMVSEIEELKAAVRQHGPAAAAINKLLSNYLGRSEIELSAEDNAFHMRRNGQPIVGTLSEGEKTALALCYFLTSLEAEGRRTSDLIVVVDDPISSLDSRALNYAFNIIRGALDGAGQLIVLTHNLHFMNEVKKWLKNKSRASVDGGRESAASLLFLETIQDVGTGLRASRIVPMPKLIREYESEYHHLFSLIWQFASQPGTHDGYFYLLPNALRKVLEVFLAFQVPGSDGLSPKLSQLIARVRGLDRAEVGALERLAHVESHGDSLEDLVSLSPMTVEETGRAIEALFKLMRMTAPDHFGRMESLCSRAA